MRYFYGQVAPTNPNLLDQWFNTATNVLYEWVSDGNSFSWDIISSPNYVMEAPLDGQLYSRMSSGWTPTPIQSDAPSALVMYVREQGAWTPLPPPVITTDAPHDGQLYGRQGSGWALAYSVSNPAGYLSATDVNSALSGYMPLAGGNFSGNVNFSVSASFATPANLNIGGGAPGNQLITNGAGGLSWLAPPGYILPVATTTVLGGVKIDGVTIAINAGGVISATPQLVVIGATPPVAPAVGTLWFDNVGAQLYLYYSDGTSSQWVPAVNQAGAGGGGALPPSNTVAPSVTGTGAVGQMLSCSQGSWSQSPTSYTYQWTRDGINIAGATTSTYFVVTADASHFIGCSVTAVNANGSASASSNTIAVAAIAPTNSAAPVVTGTGAVGQTLSTTNGTWNNSPTSYTYQWQRSGVNISGATLSTYLLVGADATTLVGCVVTASNSGGSASTGSNTISVAAVLPANTAAPVASGTGAVGATLTTTNGTWTNSPTSYSYQWLRGGVAIGGATSSSYVVQAADVGLAITCSVTAFNAYGNATAASNAINVVAAPTNSVAPVVSGGSHVGQTLTTTNGTWSGSPTYTYQWLRDGVNISGATATTYLLASADATHNVSCAVTGTNAGGAATANSNAIAVTVALPVNSVAPVVTGSVNVGSTLATTNGTWSGSPTYTYQWLRDGTNIVGATAQTYVVAIADQAHSISCAVTGTNAGGSATAGSNSLAVPAPFTFPTTAATLYSTRLIGSGYAGKALQVRRSDGTTQDIGFVGNDFDVASANTFAAGSILTVSKWYDQSGNTRDAVQATVASQPRLLIIGNRALLSFPGVLNTAATVPLTANQTIGCLHWAGVGSTQIYPLANFDGTNGWFIVDNQATKQVGYYSVGSGAYVQGGDVMAKSPARMSMTRTGTAITTYLNGSSVATGSGSNAAVSNGLTIGGYNLTSNFVGLISEIWTYPSALSTTNINAIDANQVTYWGNWGFATPYAGGAAWVQLSSNDKVDAGMPAALQFEYTQPWTCFAAIQIYGQNLQPQIIFTTVTATSTNCGYEMWVDPQNGGVLVIRLINNFTGGIYLDARGSTNLVDGKQHFVCGTYDGSGSSAGVKFYVDGNPETVTSLLNNLGGASVVSSGQKMCLGWQQPGGTTMYGCLGRVQLDKVVRSGSYVNTYSTPVSLPPIDTFTAMCFPLTEGSGTTVHDTTTNAYPATLTTAAIWVP